MNKWYETQEPKPKSPEREAELRLEAVKLWDESVGLAGTLGERYLTARKVWRPEWLGSVRWNERTRSLVSRAMNGNGVLTGVQSTPLSVDGFTRVGKRTMTGRIKGSIVRLGVEGLPLPRVVVGEGVETVLSAMILLGQSQGVACLGAQFMRHIPLASRWTHLTIAGDHDIPGGECVADLVGRLQREGGHLYKVVVPDMVGYDFNDILTSQEGKSGTYRVVRTDR